MVLLVARVRDAGALQPLGNPRPQHKVGPSVVNLIQYEPSSVNRVKLSERLSQYSFFLIHVSPLR